MRLDRILVPVDFSECTPYLLAEATRLARAVGATLTLIHVVEPAGGAVPETPFQPDASGALPDLLPARVRAARERLAPLEAFVRQAGVPARTVVSVGPTVPTLLEAAQDQGMIVMGTHGRRGLSRALLGSVAEQITRRAEIPVTTIRTHHRSDCAARSCAWCTAQVLVDDIADAAEGVGAE